MTLRTRLLLLWVLGVAAAVAMARASMWILDGMEEALETAWSASEAQRDAHLLTSELLLATQALQEHLGGQEEARAEFEQHRDESRRHLERIRASEIAVGFNDELGGLTEHLRRFDLVAERALFHRKQGDEERPLRLLRNWLDDQLAVELRSDLDEFIKAVQARPRSVRDDGIRRAQVYRWSVVVCLGALAAGVVGFGWLARRWLVDPLRRLTAQARAYGRGELSNSPALRGPPEFQRLTREMHQMAGDLATSQKTLVQHERMAAVGELTASVAHNVRNPLASIRAVAQAATFRPECDDETLKDFRTIMESVDRADRWLRDLLGVLRPVFVDRQAESLDGVLRRVVEGVEGVATARGVIFSASWPSNLGAIFLDRAKIEQTLVAICLNAIEATPVGQAVFLTAKRREKEVRITVRDEGPGMSAEMAEQVFRPFYSTKKSGAGVGLYLARKVAAGHRGRLSVETEEGEGSSFFLDLPTESLVDDRTEHGSHSPT